MSGLDYTLIRSKRKTLGLSLDRDGNITVRAPRLCPRYEADRFVKEHADWIEKQRAKLKKTAQRADEAGAISQEELKALSKAMKAALSVKLPHYAARVGVTYGRVTVRNQKSKWGSCSAKGNLNFNCLLMLAPERVLDYVIVHELCHRRHMDHSKQFWADVARVCPDYKTQRKWLKDNGGVLMKRAADGA